MTALLLDPQAWIAFITLTLLELVLGIDNIIFISILVDKLPKEERELARRLGLFFAMFTRIALLLVLSWIVGLTEPLFTLFGQVSGRDLILIAGGLFLITSCSRARKAGLRRQCAPRSPRSSLRSSSSTSFFRSIPSSRQSEW